MGEERGGREGRPPGTRRVDANGWIIDAEEDGAGSFGWREILTHWHLVEASFEAAYRIDLSDPNLLRSKTARWFTTRLFGLPTDARLWQALRPDPETDDSIDDLDKALGVAR